MFWQDTSPFELRCNGTVLINTQPILDLFAFERKSGGMLSEPVSAAVEDLRSVLIDGIVVSEGEEQSLPDAEICGDAQMGAVVSAEVVTLEDKLEKIRVFADFKRRTCRTFDDPKAHLSAEESAPVGGGEGEFVAEIDYRLFG